MRFGRLLQTVLIIGTLFAGVLFAFEPTLAQVDTSIVNNTEFQQASGLGDVSIQLTIARIIRTVLGLVGVIAVGMVLYGGFLWMTAAGNEDRVQQAKRLLVNSLIGLAIVLTSFSIAQFVVNNLVAATTGIPIPPDGDDGDDGDIPPGDTNVFILEGVSPQGEQSIRNLTVRLEFNKNVDSGTVGANVVIAESLTGDEVDGNYEVDGSGITFTPSAICEDDSDEFCFTSDTEYEIDIDSGLRSTSGLSLSCGGLYDDCVYSFTSGSLVDSEDPSVEMSYPEDGDSIEADTTIALQAMVSDDSGVGLVEFYVDDELVSSVIPDGDTSTSVIVEGEWDTSLVETGESYEIYAIAYDVNSHDAESDNVDVVVRESHCFNGVTDEDEEGEDCGGSDCGACSGESCTEDADCSSGVCEEGVCAEYPEISDVSPLSGAPGTYVTIAGSHFGSSGTVYFGETEAELIDCGDDGWSSTQIFVEVPEIETGDYDIRIETDDGYSDATNDDNGPLIDAFELNDLERPGICEISPYSGEVGQTIDVEGVNFGSSRGSSEVYFGSEEATSYEDWSNEYIEDATVPTLLPGDYAVVVSVGGVSSNQVVYEVEDADADDLPIIGSVSPSSGPEGEYVTISGSNFSASEGLVYFINNDSESTSYQVETVADVDFPAVCEEDYWSRSQVIVQVPDDLEEADYLIQVVRQDGEESNTENFTVEAGSAGPGVCLIDPDSSPAGYEDVVIYGEDFGDDEGRVVFASDEGGTEATITSWESDEILLSVPIDAETGTVVVYDSSELDSNGTLFEVGDCNEADLCDINTQQCCASGICIDASGTCPEIESDLGDASYAWRFSTGVIPDVPELIIECSDDYISPTPWAGRGGGDDVCVNAGIGGSFDISMNADSFTDESILLEACIGEGDEPCDVTSSISIGSVLTSDIGFVAYPEDSLDTDSIYKVTLTSNIQSSVGIAIEETSWQFQTRSDAELCDIASVQVTPSAHTFESLGETSKYLAQAVSEDGCVILNSTDYEWNWTISDESVADYASESGCTGEPSSCQSVEALQEGESLITAEENDQGIDDTADIIVQFTDPRIVDYWPSGDCRNACVNAEIGAEFNVEMNTSIEDAGVVVVYECTNEACVTYTNPDGIDADVDLSDADATILIVSPESYLEPNTYYEVVISGEADSTSGVPISEYYEGDFSWIFQTRDNAAPCAIDRVELNPSSRIFNYVGETGAFRASAWGPADSCSLDGQRLTTTDYNWAWSIADDLIAELWADGEAISAPDEIPDGCSASCVSEGTTYYGSLCGLDADGDGSNLDPGEECDPGDPDDESDTCSASCLNTGSESLCGNGELDAGEECDDENTDDFDGCSSICLNEGVDGGRTACGDGVVTQFETLNADGWAGGEDCDIADDETADGCSATCVYEGSISVGSIEGICGNGEIESPAEECDDGNNIDGDGCSSSCLAEGSIACSDSSDSLCCGNGLTESASSSFVYETCDDGNTTSGDGCSSRCLLEGSSTSYGEPSWCGDAIIGAGESSLCEVSASALDGLFEPEQVAVIAATAPAEVEDGSAETSITAEAEDEEDAAAIVLECSCGDDGDCSDSDALGCGSNGCCFTRPEILSNIPTATSGVCRNTEIALIFDQDMDLASFASNVQVSVEIGASDTCPHDGSVAHRGIFNRILVFIQNLFGRSATAQSSTCLLPVTFSGQAHEDGQKVVLEYNELLDSNQSYVITVTGDELKDGSGVRSEYGVGMLDDWEIEFQTGSEICELERVHIEDQDDESPGYFSEAEEEHDFVATGYTVTGGVEEAITPIEGVYDWSFDSSWWSADEDIITVVEDGSDDSLALVTSEALSGQTRVYARATIVADTIGDSAGATVTGSELITVDLCEYPWPRRIPGETWLPFMDSSEGPDDPDYDGVDEVTNDVDGDGTPDGYMHFGTYYCMGETTDNLLPELDLVSVPTPPSDEVLREYLLNASGSDGIGIRVVKNTELKPLSVWYDDSGYTGSPAAIQVDGYEALEDGRTVYVSAANQVNSGNIYGNIYVISYNENASDDTIEIFNQLLENWFFNSNIENAGVCYADESDESELLTDDEGLINCTSDIDCGSGVCHANKDKLQRDLKRLTDLRLIETELDDYSQINGLCSASISISCSTDATCPSGESCVPQYPTLASGTFLRSMTTSAWNSWDEEFSLEVGSDLPVDPLNVHTSCGEDPYSSYDSATCQDAANAQYVCPEGSHVYTYRNVGGAAYQLYVDLEYPYELGSRTWAVDLDIDEDDDLLITAGAAFTGSVDGYQESAFCDGTIYGDSGLCGDGVIGENEDGDAEICEIGDMSSVSCAPLTCVSEDADYDGRSCVIDCDDASICSGGDSDEDGICDSGSAEGLYCGTGSVDCTDIALCTSFEASGSGTQTTTCSIDDSCLSYEVAFGAECVPQRCGDGVVDEDLGEECDDGSRNGEYGFCGESCTYDDAFYCGDGTLSGSEVCDCGDGDGIAYGGGTCDGVLNGAYVEDATLGCSYSCDGPSLYCGDGEISAGEVCDGDSEEWDGAICCGGTYDDTACGGEFGTSTCESGGGTCETDGGSCGSSYGVCEGEEEDIDGDGEADITYPTTRTKSCGTDCEYSVEWSDLSCAIAGSCGNGIVEGDEACDDGNDSNNDACTNYCTENVCGDGFLYSGYETCDLGDENGEVCDAGYGTTCRYCSSSCVYLTASGDFCGDGEWDDSVELCDGALGDHFYCVNTELAYDTVGASCETRYSSEECSDGAFCHEAGICNGGNNAVICLTDTNCSGFDIGAGYGECVLPECGDDCASACPFVFTDGEVSIISEEAGSIADDNINLYSYESGDSPDEATLVIPECRVATAVEFDLSQDGREFDNTDIFFILDRSKSMNTILTDDGQTRLDILKSVVNEMFDDLHDTFSGTGATLRIGYASMGGLHCSDVNGDGDCERSETYVDGSDIIGPVDEYFSFVDVSLISDESSLSGFFSDMSPLTSDDDTGTPLYEAIYDAYNEELADSTADKRYLIIFTDGNIYNTSDEYDLISGEIAGEDDEYMEMVSDLTDEMKASGIEVFTATLTETVCDINQMARWSSMECAASGSSCSGVSAEGNYTCDVPDNGITYAFDATDADGLESMFEEISDVMLGITVTLTDSYGGTTELMTRGGNNLVMDLPSGFACDEEDETNLKIQATFGGEGTIGISDINVEMCTP